MINDSVKDYKVLVKKPRHDEALQLLKRLASQVKPILSNRKWTIKNLVEFFPSNPNLLGMNVNRGWKVNLRLRPHYDETQFLEYEDLLGTLLHEMAHIVRGPHDETFYKLLDELKKETEILMASGYTGEGFYSDGKQLGSQSVPRYQSNAIAAKAAEKRRQISEIMLPTGGIRLGGSDDNNMTPAQSAARAAQKRQLDKVWCGGSVKQESSAPSSPAAVPSSSPSVNHVITRKRKLSFNTIIPKMDTQSTTTQNKWACPTCTFLNGPIKLACEICLTQRPHDDDPADDNDDDVVVVQNGHWSCPQCTLKNETKWSTCIACQYVHLQ